MKPDRLRAFAPPDYSSDRGKAGVSAIQWLATGKADEGAQKIAMDYIINDLCRAYDVSYRPDDAGGDRDTAFAEGRRFIGLQLARIISTSFDQLTGK
jgi:hypothetical protein